MGRLQGKVLSHTCGDDPRQDAPHVKLYDQASECQIYVSFRGGSSAPYFTSLQASRFARLNDIVCHKDIAGILTKAPEMSPLFYEVAKTNG